MHLDGRGSLVTLSTTAGLPPTSAQAVRGLVTALSPLTPVRVLDGSWLAAKARRAGLRRPGRRRTAIVPLMGLQRRTLLSAALRYDVVPVCWDVWEPMIEPWADVLRAQHARTVFTTSADARAALAELLPGTDVQHLPEAIEVAAYPAGPPLAQRDVHVLELGRRWEAFHDRITAALRDAGAVHRYETVKGTIIADGPVQELLHRSAISVCFPSAVTHPQRSGGYSTMTMRYLESIACGCLVVGRAPRELVELFGFDPVVELGPDDDAGARMVELVADLDSYQPFVDRARARLVEVADWSLRARTVVDTLNR